MAKNNSKVRPESVLWLALTLGLIWFVQVLEGGRIGEVLQGTASLTVIGLTLLSTANTLGLRATLTGFASILGFQTGTSEARVEFAQIAGARAWDAAFVGMLFGMIKVFKNLDAGTAILGEGIAIAIVSLFYAAVFNLILGAANTGQGGDRIKSRTGVLLGSLGILVGLFAMLFALSQFYLKKAEQKHSSSDPKQSSVSAVKPTASGRMLV